MGNIFKCEIILNLGQWFMSRFCLKRNNLCTTDKDRSFYFFFQNFFPDRGNPAKAHL